MPHGSIFEVVRHGSGSGWLQESDESLVSDHFDHQSHAFHRPTALKFAAPCSAEKMLPLSNSTRSSFNSFLTGDGALDLESMRAEMGLSKDLLLGGRMRRGASAPFPFNIEQDGPGTTGDLEQQDQLLPDLPPAMPQPKGRMSANMEYWSVDSNGNGAHVLADGAGHVSAKEFHHSESDHHHHGGGHHKWRSSTHHAEDSRHHEHERRHHDSSSDRHQKPPRDPRSDEDYHERTSRHEEDMNQRDDSRQHDEDHEDDRGRYVQRPQEPEDGPNGAAGDEPSAHPVIIISDPKTNDTSPTAIIGGLVAIFAQGYLWGTVFVTLFKKENRAAPASNEPQQGSQTQNAPSAPASSRDSPQEATQTAGPPMQSSQQESSSNRFSGASGLPGAHMATAVAPA